MQLLAFLTSLVVGVACLLAMGELRGVAAVQISRNGKTCQDNYPVEKREEIANVVISGYIHRIMRKPRTIMYDCDIEVVRVFKGYDDLHSKNVIPPMDGNTIQIGGFGDPMICENAVTPGDTRIFMLNKNGDGHLMLNSSVIRITLNNLVQAEAAVFDVPFVTRKPERKGPCDLVLCIFGAVCVENEEGRPQCICDRECPDIMAPVCGSDGTTYLSECFLDKASCEQKRRLFVSSQGSCDEQDPCQDLQCSFGSECIIEGGRATCECPDVCQLVYEPVCGSDGFSYSNVCEMKTQGCRLQKNITVLNEGECVERDPCDNVTCSYGASCVVEGSSASCLCPEICLESYNPVCGSDAVDYKNECELTATACSTQKNITVVFTGLCDPCQEVQYENAVCKLDRNRQPQPSCEFECPTNMADPVCGSDGTTYDNDCEISRAACLSNLEGVLITFTEGPCEDGTHPCEEYLCDFGQCLVDDAGMPQCVCTPCPEVYHPVCGSDGMTYSSVCHMEEASCMEETDITLTGEGACDGFIADGCETPACTAMESALNTVCGTDGNDYPSLCVLQMTACEMEIDIQLSYYGLCRSCETLQCTHGSFCQMAEDGPSCMCSDHCQMVNLPVCGSDGATYASECELNVNACNLLTNITVVSYGSCEDCVGVTCETERYNQVCYQGMCVCQESCPMSRSEEEMVCGSDSVTYDTVCHLKAAACQRESNLTVEYYGPCDEFSGSGTEFPDFSGSGATPPNEFEFDLCDETSCSFGGICRPLSADTYECICKFNCPAVRLPVCGSDGATYGNECQLKEAACEQQSSIVLEKIGTCEDVEMEPCDGESPLVNEATMEEYTCQEDNGGEDCPSGSYCHIHPLGKFSVCCAVTGEQTSQASCIESTYGCCPDNQTEALGDNGEGCPSVCNCNPLGSYSVYCEPVNLQCPCKPGIGGKQCDRCEPGYYDFLSLESHGIGCKTCGCSPYGSRRDDCDQTSGACRCRRKAIGLKCNMCPEGLTMTPMGCMTEEEQMLNSAVTCTNLTCPFHAQCQESTIEGQNATCVCPTSSSCNNGTSQVVCGDNGETYPSRCQLEVFACKEQRSILVQNEGACETVIVTPNEIRPGCEESEFGCCPDLVTFATGPNFEGCSDASGTPKTADQSSGQASAGSSSPPVPPPAKTSAAITTVAVVPSTVVPSTTISVAPFVSTAFTTDSVQGTTTVVTIVLGCDSSPCQHGGTCQNDEIAPGFRCICPLGKGGPVCNEAMTFTTPSFAGDSYLAFPAMDAFMEVEIVIEFQPNATEGVLLYEAQTADGNGDFISLAIVNNHVEFRFLSTDQSNGFDLGSADPVVITSTVTLEPTSWHRLRAYRSRREGTLSVDGEAEVTGTSEGVSGALNLGEDLFIGYAVPPEVGLRLANTNQGFVGCMRYLEINGQELDISSSSSYIEYGAQVGECGKDPCQSKEVPCFNNGICEAINAEAYRCICQGEYFGALCGDVLVDQCEGHMCHEESTCVALPEGGYRCDCPEGRMGDMCDDEINKITVPGFAGNSYVELPSLMMPDTSVIEVEFLTSSPDGIVFYNGQSTDGRGDFISLNVRDGYLEFRYDLGSSIAEIKSVDRIAVNEWHTVRVIRMGKSGEMILDNLPPVKGTSPPGASQLNLRQPLFIGGVRSYEQVSRRAAITDGLDGAIRRFVVNQEDYSTFKDFAVAEVNLEEFREDTMNMIPTAPREMPEMPVTTPRPPVAATRARPAMTTASVLVINTDDPLRFDGQTSIQYYNGISKKQRALRTHQVQLSFKTAESNGALLWNGVGNADFQAVGLSDGYVEYAYNLGRGITRIRSTQKVDNNKWHTVIITRNLIEASLHVDNAEPVMGESRAGASQLDTDGYLYLGRGVNVPGSMVSSYTYYTGCIKDVLLDEVPLHLYEHSQGERPSLFCSGP